MARFCQKINGLTLTFLLKLVKNRLIYWYTLENLLLFVKLILKLSGLKKDPKIVHKLKVTPLLLGEKWPFLGLKIKNDTFFKVNFPNNCMSNEAQTKPKMVIIFSK